MLLMTVGGSNNVPSTKKDVKLYSLSGDFSVPSCLQNLADLQINRANAAGATLGPGLFKLCSENPTNMLKNQIFLSKMEFHLYVVVHKLMVTKIVSVTTPAMTLGLNQEISNMIITNLDLHVTQLWD